MPSHLVNIKDKLFENIFDHAPNGIAIVGLDFRWVKVNQSLMNLLGYSEDEFYTMTFPDITHKEDVDVDMEQLGQLLKGDIDQYQIEKRYFHKTGRLIWGLSSVSLEYGETTEAGESPLYFIFQMVDITKQKEMLGQMNAITNIANIQNERLKDFAHIATHDIRTHLGNLSVISGFMEEELEDIKHDNNFIMLKEALCQLENTISNLNEVRQADFSAKGKLTPLNLKQFVESAIYNINAIARHEGCEIINTIKDPIHVLAIPVYLDSVILNLLSNAIKYSSKERQSYVKLGIKETADIVVLEVEDNGLGINLDAHQYELFQFKKTFHKREDARGIGLFITKNHVDSMGGKITVESQVGVGSTFKVALMKA
ncbi:HAMP domain-containing sensor histidine kinase [uncultured Gelidibacter sp.]|uniref:sensor histidine kinase n=1 Tax=uncultured Gelidibacter sp. TaxID=259318 RepID=UPI0026067574|nr:sensor histidine kinase [uncultured Gelidibacter sp.]